MVFVPRQPILVLNVGRALTFWFISSYISERDIGGSVLKGNAVVAGCWTTGEVLTFRRHLVDNFDFVLVGIQKAAGAEEEEEESDHAASRPVLTLKILFLQHRCCSLWVSGQNFFFWPTSGEQFVDGTMYRYSFKHFSRNLVGSNLRTHPLTTKLHQYCVVADYQHNNQQLEWDISRKISLASISHWLSA